MPGVFPPVPLIGPAKRPVPVSAVLTIIQGGLGIIPAIALLGMLTNDPGTDHMEYFSALSLLLLVATLAAGIIDLRSRRLLLVRAVLTANIACSAGWLLAYALPYLASADDPGELSGLGVVFAAVIGVPAVLYALMPIIGLSLLPSDLRRLAAHQSQPLPPHPSQWQQTYPGHW